MLNLAYISGGLVLRKRKPLGGKGGETELAHFWCQTTELLGGNLGLGRGSATGNSVLEEHGIIKDAMLSKVRRLDLL